MPDEIMHTIEECEHHGDRQFVTALARGLAVLHALRFYPQGMSHQHIYEVTGLPKATVSRLLYTLVRLRFLRQNRLNNFYQPDIRYIEFVHAAQSACDPAEAARPLMTAFARQHQVSVSLAIEEHGEMLYLQSIRSPARITVQLDIGSALPLADTAIGRAYFAALGAGARHALSNRLRRMLGKDLPEKMDALAEQQIFFAQHGYTYSAGEFLPEITAVAVALHSPAAKHGVYALNASVPSSSYRLEELVSHVVEPLKALARDLEKTVIAY